MRDTYKIVRCYANTPRKRTLLTGLSLEQAQEHCNSHETSSRTATSSAAKAITRRNGPWFDAYYKE